MHQLFHTAVPPFSYFTAHSTRVLDELQQLWRVNGDGPLVTMDAGRNIHLLYRVDQHALRERMAHHYQEQFHVL